MFAAGITFNFTKEDPFPANNNNSLSIKLGRVIHSNRDTIGDDLYEIEFTQTTPGGAITVDFYRTIVCNARGEWSCEEGTFNFGNISDVSVIAGDIFDGDGHEFRVIAFKSYHNESFTVVFIFTA